MQGHIPQELDGLLLADFMHAIAGAEDGMWRGAVGTCEEGHVVDQAQDGDVDLFEHVDALDGVFDGEGVRGCYYHRACMRKRKF